MGHYLFNQKTTLYPGFCFLSAFEKSPLVNELKLIYLRTKSATNNNPAQIYPNNIPLPSPETVILIFQPEITRKREF